MFYDDERAAVEQRLKTYWAASAFSAVAIAYENRRHASNGQPYIEVAIRNGQSRQISLGSHPWIRHDGLIIISIFVGENTGQATARQMADVVDAAFRNAQFSHGSSGKITCRTPFLTVFPANKGWWKAQLSVPYQRDVRPSAPWSVLVDLPDVEAWYDPSQTIGRRVIDDRFVNLYDLTGNGNDLGQPTYSRRPTLTTQNGLYCVQGAALKDMIGVPSENLKALWNGGGYVLGVWRHDESASGAFMWNFATNAGGATGWQMFTQVDSSVDGDWTDLQVDMNGAWSSYTEQTHAPSTRGVWQIREFLFDAEADYEDNVNPAIYRNGTLKQVIYSGGSVPVGPMVPEDNAYWTLGGGNATWGGGWIGPIGEQIICKSIPTAAQRLAAREALATKWGITL